MRIIGRVREVLSPLVNSDARPWLVEGDSADGCNFVRSGALTPTLSHGEGAD